MINMSFLRMSCHFTFVHLTSTLWRESSHSRVTPDPSGCLISSSFFRIDTGISEEENESCQPLSQNISFDTKSC